MTLNQDEKPVNAALRPLELGRLKWPMALLRTSAVPWMYAFVAVGPAENSRRVDVMRIFLYILFTYVAHLNKNADRIGK